MYMHTIQALVAALRFDRPDTQALQALDDSDWRSLLEYTDRMHVTLALASRHRDVVPQWVRERLDRNIAGNAACLERDRTAYLEIAAAFERSGIEVAILKGLSHDAPLRPQGDLDLFCTPESATRAQEVAIGLGYVPITELNEFAADHLPLLVRPAEWRWRGDYFDPEKPPAVEIHFRLWDEATERIHVEGTEEFWARRQPMTAHGLRFAAFDPVDRLSYAALHILRHILRGDLVLWHIYELALMLHRCAADAEFWTTWQARCDDTFRQLQSIVFRLAHNWFGCRLHESPDLPEAVERWFDLYAREPGGPRRLFPNKSEVWLHTSLVGCRADAFHVVRRKLLPIQKRRLIEHPNVGEPGLKSKAGRVARQTRFLAGRVARQTRFLAGRAAHHARTLPVALLQGLSWSLRSRGLSSGFFRYLGAASLFNIGMGAFFLLYNLHLLKRGFNEDFIGSVVSASTTGTILGLLLAGYITSRFGLKASLQIAYTIGPLIGIARTLVASPTWLVRCAFLDGFALCMNAVALMPTVAQLTSEKARPLAFSLVTSLGIGIGIIGSAIGGKLPIWLGGLQPALLLACAVATLGGLAVTRLPLVAPPAKTRTMYPRDPAVFRFLAALGLWSLATGTLNPFFNVYFAKHLKVPPGGIGLIFSGAHLTSVLAILAAPLVLRRFGMPLGVMAMQMAAGLALAGLAVEPPLAGAAVLFASYQAFQYMSEPGMFTFLMDHASAPERGGAASMYMLILFAGQAIASRVSGLALVRFGYPAVMITAALLAIVAGLCFRLAMSRRTPVLLERTAVR
jgi:MFS family permease